jgi:iron complex outermembrane receptor protein
MSVARQPRWCLPADSRRVQIWGKNVTNKGYWSNVVHIYDTYDRITGQPVTYGITFSAKF